MLAPEALALGSALFAALAQVLSKRAVVLVAPPTFLLVKWIAALVGMTVAVTVVGGWPDFVAKPELVYILLGTLLGPIGAWSLYAYAIARLDVSVAYPIAQVSTLGSLLAAALFLGERPSPYAAGGAVLIVAGVVLLQQRPPGRHRLRLSTSGLLLAAGAAVCWSTTYVFWKLSAESFPVWQTNWIRALIPTLVTASAISWQQRGRSEPILKGTRGGLLLAALSAISHDVVGFLFTLTALSIGNVSTVTPIAASSPFFVILLSALFLGERLHRRALGGVILILVGVWLVAALGKA